MSLQVENLEKNMAKLTITVSAQEFEKALNESFQKNKNKFSVPGFRKGKVPRDMVEKFYGNTLYKDATDIILDKTYADAVEESGLDIVSNPEIDIKEIGKGKDFVYTATVAVKPEVILGQYKGVEVKRADEEVSEEDIEQALKKEQDRNARLITVDDRPVEDGDNLLIDFEGGKAEDYPLVIGSGSFIAGFEEQVKNHSLGEEFDINVAFPENYHAKELAGKPAVFTVKIKEIKKKELPELDDEFASEISEFETLDEYKADLKNKLSEAKKKSAAYENENTVINKVIENTALEIPEPMVETQANKLLQNYINNISSNLSGQGLTFEQYMQYTGTTIEGLREQMKERALKSIKTSLVLEAIVKAENIEVSKERVEEEIEKLAKDYKMEVEQFRKVNGDNVMENLKLQEAVDFIVAEAKLV